MEETAGKVMFNREIAEKRKNSIVPRLVAIAGKCSEYRDRLAKVAAAKNVLDGQQLPEIEEMTKKLHEFQNRVDLRRRRYENGMVTVAIIGLEKGGKTTLLKTLTGIEELPAEDKRCTAASCEILYDANNEVGSFDIDFYSKEEFPEAVLKPLIERINEDATQSKIMVDGAPFFIILPETIYDFRYLQIPSRNPFLDEEGRSSRSPLWPNLEVLKKYAETIENRLGEHSRKKQPLQDLPLWVARDNKNPQSSRLADTTTVKRCRIYKAFKGGSENLRLMDTPGFDDPNPRARELALKTVSEEADLVAVLVAPRKTPDPTTAFEGFWRSLHSLKDELSLMSRLLIFQNWHKSDDPDGIKITEHRRALTGPEYSIQTTSIIGPIDATSEEGVDTFMNRVNRHLEDHLADQDQIVINKIEDDLDNLTAELRLKVYVPLRERMPVDTDTRNLINDFFEDNFKSLWENILQSFNNAVFSSPTNQAVENAQKMVLETFAKEAESIMKLPSVEQADILKINHKNEALVSFYMRDELSPKMSDLVNKLANVVNDFGPVIQSQICDILEAAGLKPFMPGNIPEEKLKNFCELIEKTKHESGFKDVFKELVALPGSLQYVYRFEMRPAVDYFDPALWTEKKAGVGSNTFIPAVEGLRHFIKAYGADEPAPPSELVRLEAETQIHLDKLDELVRTALSAIEDMLNSERCRLSRIFADVLRDTRVRLTLHEESNTMWRKVVNHNIGLLWPADVAEIQKNSLKQAVFQSALGAFAEVLK